MPELGLTQACLTLLVDLLQQHVPSAEVWAFGSRLEGTWHEGSDLDLVLRNPRDPSLPLEDWSSLVTALQESRLPILVDLHEWSRLPDSFQQKIQRHHAVLKPASASS